MCRSRRYTIGPQGNWGQFGSRDEMGPGDGLVFVRPRMWDEVEVGSLFSVRRVAGFSRRSPTRIRAVGDEARHVVKSLSQMPLSRAERRPITCELLECRPGRLGQTPFYLARARASYWPISAGSRAKTSKPLGSAQVVQIGKLKGLRAAYRLKATRGALDQGRSEGSALRGRCGPAKLACYTF